MRPSERAPDLLRPVSLETGVTRYAEGSCLASFGHTRVLVTAAQLIAAGATELDAAEACILAPLSSDEYAFIARDSGERHVLSHHVLQSLDQCREFRSIDEHVARVAAVVPGAGAGADTGGAAARLGPRLGSICSSPRISMSPRPVARKEKQLLEVSNSG